MGDEMSIVFREEHSDKSLDILQCIEKIFHNSVALVTIIQISTMSVLFVNKAWEKAMGRTFEQAVGKTPQDLGFGNCHEVVQKIKELDDDSSILPYELSYYAPTGEKRTLICKAILVKDGSERYVIFIDFDITRNKQVEERFRMAFHHNVSPMSISRFIDGYYIEVNQAFLTFMGYTKEEVIGKNSSELNIFVELDRKAVINALKKRGYFQNYEYKIRTKQGELRYCLLNADVIVLDNSEYLLASMTDITERKKLELALKKNEKNLNVAEQIAKIGYFDWDVVADRMSWSDQMYRNLGFVPGEVKPTEKLYLSMIHPDDFSWVSEYISYAKDHSLYDVQYGIIKANGEITWLHLRANMNFNNQGKLIKMFGTCQDITEQKLGEDRVQKAESELSLTNQAYIQSAFFYNVINSKEPIEVTREKLQQYGINPRATYICCVLRMTKQVPNIVQQSVFVWLLSNLPGWVWQYNQVMIALIPVVNNNLSSKAGQIEYGEQLLQEIERCCQKVPVKIGISGLSQTTLNIKELYVKGFRSLIVGEVRGSSITHYEDIGYYELAFCILENKGSGGISTEAIEQVAVYDQDNGTSFLQTLKMLLKEPNFKMVARNLFIHYNTVIWRKQKIEKMLGLSLDDFEVKCQLLLQLRIWEIKKVQKVILGFDI